mmetsp:Transcript_2968/g.4251  ORF Transcript_2968/g.4251 Transcript_2968/m.4251 type:complete len:86 (-) Transcript_2968:113-370(-)
MGATSKSMHQPERLAFSLEPSLIHVTSSFRMDATTQRKIRGVGKTNISRVPIAELRKNAASRQKRRRTSYCVYSPARKAIAQVDR